MLIVRVEDKPVSAKDDISFKLRLIAFGRRDGAGRSFLARVNRVV